MRKIEKESLLPRYYQLEQILISRIRKMKPGTRLPSVQQLKKEYNLSQATTDKALSLLAKRGLILSEKGKGTFVKDVNMGKNVLWICGRDIFKGDISPYYTHSFQCCAEELKKQGYHLTPLIWENKSDAEFSFDNYSNYAGYIFISCDVSHPLLNHVKIKKLPYVHMSNDFFDYNTVVADEVHGLKLAAEYFSGRMGKNGYVAIIGNEEDRMKVEKAYNAMSPKLEFKFFGADFGTKIREVTKAGYGTAKEAFSKKVSPSYLFITDDILALGVINAVFELSYNKFHNIDLLVRGSGQIPIPFPLPISYLSISPEHEAHISVQMLLKRIVSGGSNIKSQVLPYGLLNMKKERLDIADSNI